MFSKNAFVVFLAAVSYSGISSVYAAPALSKRVVAPNLNTVSCLCSLFYTHAYACTSPLSFIQMAML